MWVDFTAAASRISLANPTESWRIAAKVPSGTSIIMEAITITLYERRKFCVDVIVVKRM